MVQSLHSKMFHAAVYTGMHAEALYT